LRNHFNSLRRHLNGIIKVFYRSLDLIKNLIMK